MAMTRMKRAPYVVLGLCVFAALSQVVDLAVGAPEVGARVAVLLVATAGALATVGWLLRHRRAAPEPARRPYVTSDMAPEDPEST
jgi:hypothetical protein